MSRSPPWSVGLSIQHEAMDVGLSAQRRTYYHLDVVSSLNTNSVTEQHFYISWWTAHSRHLYQVRDTHGTGHDVHTSMVFSTQGHVTARKKGRPWLSRKSAK